MKRVLTISMPLVGLTIFAFIVYRTGLARIIATLSTIEWPPLLWAPVIVGAIALVRGARWHYVIRSVGLSYRFRRCVVVYNIGFFASSVTPAKAGDVFRAVYLRNETGCPMGQAFLTVFVDRLWDLLFVLAAGTVSAFVFSARYIEIPSAPLLGAGVLIIALLAATATRRTWVRALLKPAVSVIVPARYRDGLSASFHTFYDAMREHGSRPVRSLVMAGYTAICWILILLLAVYVSRLLSLPIHIGYIILIMPVVTVVELIPFSISGLGTRDAAVIYFFSIVGVGAAEAVGFSIVYLLIGTYLMAFAGFLLWLRHPVRWRSERP